MAKSLLVHIAFICAGIIVGSAQNVFNAHADDIRSELIHIPEGESGVTVNGQITGHEIIDYKFYVCEAQDVIVVLETNNTSNYFNIMAPGESEVVMFIGSIEGNRYAGRMPENGDYTFRVYLMRNAARRGEKASYSLTINAAGNRTACQATRSST